LTELAEAGWPAARLVVAPMPLPARLTVVGLLLALLVTVRVPVRVPDAVGLNVTVTVHELPVATLEQLLVWLKSPVTVTPETDAALVPELVTVTVLAAELDPTTVPAKDRLAGAAPSTGRGGAGAGEADRVGHPARVDREVPGPGAGRGRRELHADRARAVRRDRRAAGVGWLKSPLAATDETGRPSRSVGDRHGLGAAGRAGHDRAEAQRARAGRDTAGRVGGYNRRPASRCIGSG